MILAVSGALIGQIWAIRRRVEPVQVVISLILNIDISTIINLIKGPYLDLDPLNVYFCSSWTSRSELELSSWLP